MEPSKLPRSHPALLTFQAGFSAIGGLCVFSYCVARVRSFQEGERVLLSSNRAESDGP